MIFSVPLCIIAAKISLKFRIKWLMRSTLNLLSHNINQERSSFELEQIDLFLRILSNSFVGPVKKYLGSSNSIYFEKIVTQHHERCDLFPNCFCNQSVESQSLNFENVGEAVRRKYLEHYILEVYRKEMKHIKSKINVCLFNYLSYLITEVKNQTMSLREIFQLKQIYYQKANLFQKQVISYFLELANTEFTNQTKVTLTNQSQIIDIIEYDDSLEECQKIYKASLEAKLRFLQQISSDYINIIFLENNAQELQTKRTILLSNLKRLFLMNCSHPILRRICDGFEECLALEQVFSRMHEEMIKKGKNVSTIPLYQEDSTAIYITLMSDIGKIIKVSKNFSSVIPMLKSNLEVIGKNINFLQIDEIAAVHDNILIHCIQKKQINHEIKSLPLVIGKDAKGWSVAYSFKVQLCMLNNQELGACGLLKRISNGNMYMMTASESGNYKILITDEQLFQNIFGSQFSQQEIKKIHLSNLIPSLKSVCKTGNTGTAYDMVIIKPISMKHALKERITNKDGMFDEIMKETLIQIRFSFYPIKNEFLDLIQIQVFNLRNLTMKTLKKDALRNLKLQIHKLNYLDIISASEKNYAKSELINLLKNEQENLQAKQVEVSESDTFKSEDSANNQQLQMNHTKSKEFTNKIPVFSYEDHQDLSQSMKESFKEQYLHDNTLNIQKNLGNQEEYLFQYLSMEEQNSQQNINSVEALGKGQQNDVIDFIGLSAPNASLVSKQISFQSSKKIQSSNNIKQNSKQPQKEYEKVNPFIINDTLNYQNILSQDSTLISPNYSKPFLISDHSAIKNPENSSFKYTIKHPKDIDRSLVQTENKTFIESNGTFNQKNIIDKWQNQVGITRKYDDKSRSSKNIEASSPASNVIMGKQVFKKDEEQDEGSVKSTNKTTSSSSKYDFLLRLLLF